MKIIEFLENKSISYKLTEGGFITGKLLVFFPDEDGNLWITYRNTKYTDNGCPLISKTQRSRIEQFCMLLKYYGFKYLIDESIIVK